MGAPVVAGVDSTPVFELSGHVLDLVALAGAKWLACGAFASLQRNHRCNPQGECPQKDNDNQIYFPPLTACGIPALDPEDCRNLAPDPVDDASLSHRSFRISPIEC